MNYIKRIISILIMIIVMILSASVMSSCGGKTESNQTITQSQSISDKEKQKNAKLFDYYSAGTKLTIIKKDIKASVYSNYGIESKITIKIGDHITLTQPLYIKDDNSGSISLQSGQVCVQTSSNKVVYVNPEQLRYRTTQIGKEPIKSTILDGEFIQELITNGKYIGIPWWGLLLLLILVGLGFFFLTFGFAISDGYIDFGDEYIDVDDFEEFGPIILLNVSPALVMVLGVIIYGFSSASWVLIIGIVIASLLLASIIYTHITGNGSVAPLTILGAIGLNFVAFLLVLLILVVLFFIALILLGIALAIIVVPIIYIISRKTSENQIGNY